MKKILLLALTLASCAHTSSSGIKGVTPTVSDTYISPLPSRGIDYGATIERIAFGSCANQDEPQPLWKDIAATQPDLFLFAGDNVYASSPHQKPIAEQYRKLDQIAEYRLLREQVPFLATWDDHDYGQRDGGADWSGKEAARRDFINYWAYARNSMPLERGGVYHSKIIGPKKRQVQVIMLDTRYYRSPLKESPGNEGKGIDYLPDESGTILGEAQWQWLEAELKRPANVRLIVSSIQLVATEPRFEKWGNFPKERQRFFDLLRSTRAKNVILISGDRHFGSIAKVDLKEHGALYEITASSINRANNYSDSDSHYLGPAYNRENFGLAKIDWNKKLVEVELRGLNNQTINAVQIPFK